MPRLNALQLDDLREGVEKICEFWKAGQNPAGKDFTVLVGFPNVQIRRNLSVDCQRADQIQGQFGMHVLLHLPAANLGTPPAEYWDQIKPFVASVIVQEFTHFLQQKEDREGYNAAAHAQKQWLQCLPHGIDTVTPAELLSHYYDTPREFEAHAAQVAAEALFSNLNPRDTHTWKRMVARLGSAMDQTTDFGSRFAAAVEDDRVAWLCQRFSGNS